MSDIQAAFLSTFKNNQQTIAIYLKSGIRLIGQVLDFDNYTIFLSHQRDDKKIRQLIYKQAIAAVMPFVNKSV